MTPGTYLRKRREASRLTLPMVADAIAGLPWAIRPVTVSEIARMIVLLRQAEADNNNMSVRQAEVVRNAYPFSIEIYQSLLLRHYRGPDCGVPLPQLCRYCACSWEDACVSGRGAGCAWVPGDDTLCTACLPRAVKEAEQLRAAEAELGPSPVTIAVEMSREGAAA